MTYIDYCPSCGKWDLEIVDDTGWCVPCSRAHHPNQMLYCKRCSSPFPRNKNSLYCSPCKDRVWLEQHIDQVEAYMLQGHSFTKAKKLVAADIRPVCVICGQPIRGGKPHAMFCRQTPACRKGKQRYHSLINKHVPAEIAIEIIQEAA